MSTTSAVASASDSAILQQYIEQQKAAAAATTASKSSTTATSLSKVTGDFNTFLKILTTQLQNQDPLNATDTNQFTQELVQFSGVEQQINTNAKLDSILASLNSNGITPLLNYVGKTVEVPANGQLVLQGGAANFAYTLPYAAQGVKITITNSAGKTLATMDGPKTSGVNRVSWDGVTSDGTQLSDGTYNLKIVATDGNGKTIEASNVDIIGKVNSIETASDGATTLSIGSKKINATDIVAVYSGIATSTAS